MVRHARFFRAFFRFGIDSSNPYGSEFCTCCHRYFRMLKAQGKNAAGGAYDYVVKGKMIGGFAVIAFPAKYGNSGVMTFLVNHEGVVLQKNLGKNTEQIAKAIKKFDPDTTWKKAQASKE